MHKKEDIIYSQKYSQKLHKKEVDKINSGGNVMFNKILKMLSDGENLFITGGGGVGKSYLLNQLKEHFGDKLTITGTTGISVVEIGGQTLHSWCGIGIADKPVAVTVNIIKNKKPVVLNQIMNCKMLAIDEVSMLSSDVMEYVDSVLKKIRGSDEPFGGIQVILLGDFFQLPPVKKDEEKESVAGTGSGRPDDEDRKVNDNEDYDFCFKSYVWKSLNLKTVMLKKVHRQKDEKFINVLERIRTGEANDEDFGVLRSRSTDAFDDNRDTLKLFAHNVDADAYNRERFDEINASPFVYESVDIMYVKNNYDEEKINEIRINEETYKNLSADDVKCYMQFEKNCKIPKILELKEGCKVILLRNIDIDKGLVNGSRGVVKKITSDSIDVEFKDGRVSIGRFDFEYSQNGKLRVRRIQFPLKLAYGITIHKSQGMSLDDLSVDFSHITFAGQVYVALSRVKTAEGLFLKNFNPNKIAASKIVKRFYDELSDSDDCIVFNE